MRDRTEFPVGQELPRAAHERLIPLPQRHRDECVLRRRLLRDASHLLGVLAHRLFHQEGIPAVEQVVRHLRHRVVTAQRDDEIRADSLQHVPVIREGRRFTERGGALRRDRRIGVVQADDPHVLERGEMPEVRRVVERVPVTDADGRDAYRHDRMIG